MYICTFQQIVIAIKRIRERERKVHVMGVWAKIIASIVVRLIRMPLLWSHLNGKCVFVCMCVCVISAFWCCQIYYCYCSFVIINRSVLFAVMFMCLLVMYCLIFAACSSLARWSSSYFDILSNKFITLPFIASQCCTITLSYSTSNRLCGWIFISLSLSEQSTQIYSISTENEKKTGSITFCIDFMALF